MEQCDRHIRHECDVQRTSTNISNISNNYILLSTSQQDFPLDKGLFKNEITTYVQHI